MADNSTVPTIQDMLVLDILNNDEEEFDARRLEELAESLLADITADLEAGDRAGDDPPPKTPGGTECLPGSVVGTTTKCLESCENIETDNSNSIKEKLETEASSQETLNGNCEEDTPPLTIELPQTDTTPETVYGTYDAKTNSITIVMDDGSAPVNEAVEEIYCDGVEPPIGDDVIECPTPVASPSQVYLNINCDTDDDDDDILNFDPISKFLCPKRPLVSPLGKSPVHSIHSANSDHGYESIIGSPIQTPLALTEDTFEEMEDFSWHDNSFNELFPTLI